MNRHERDFKESLHYGWAAGLVAAAFLVGGCHTTPYRKGDATAERLQATAAAVQQEQQALTASLNSLDNLVNRPAPDLQVQFKTYSASVDRLYDSINNAEKRMKRMQKESARYVAAWDKKMAAMNYEAVRDRAEARRSAVTNEIVTITSHYRDSREALLPLLAYFEDIRKALSADLTMDGLQATKDLAAKTRTATEKVQPSLEQVTAELTDSGNRLASIGTTTASEGTSPSTGPERVTQTSAR